MNANRILRRARVLSGRVSQGAGSLVNDVKNSSPLDKFKLGLGLTGTTMGIAAFARNSMANSDRAEVDHESLTALKKIHKALISTPPNSEGT